jgi:histidine triad (HIT) family protein
MSSSRFAVMPDRIRVVTCEDLPTSAGRTMSSKSIFKRIIDRDIPANILYEDEYCLAFHDIAPQAPVHFLVIPKKEITGISGIGNGDKELVGHLMTVIRDLAGQLQLENGYRVISNCGADAGQTVFHLHFHVLAGNRLSWP